MRLGLRQKLVVLVLVILVPLLVLLAFDLYRFFSLLEKDQLTAHVRDAQIVGTSLDRLMHELAQVSKTAGLAVVDRGPEAASAESYLALVRTHVPVSNVAVLDLRGLVRASGIPGIVGRDFAGEPGFRAVLSGAPVAVSDMRRNASGNLGFVVFTAVQRDGKLLAVTGAAVDARDLGEVVPSSVSHEALIITDSRGSLMYSNRPELARLTEQQRRDLVSPGVTEALGGRTYTTRSTRLPLLDGQWLGAEVPVGTTGWSVGLFDSSGSALAAISDEAYLTAAVTAAVIAVSLLAARRYGSAITDPVEHLIAVTGEIERGRFDAEVPVTTHDEIGELALNFRRMQDSLKHTIGDVQLLADSARWMSSTLDLDSVGHAAADYLDRVLGARAVAIVLSADGRPEGTRLIAPRMSAQAAEELAAAGADVAARLDIQHRGYAIVGIEPGRALAAAVPGATTLVVLPLVVNRKLIGRIDALVGPGAQRREFERADVPLAASLAQQVAQAAANARLFEQQRTIADTLQDSLLTEPYRIPELDIGLIYHQATVGGRIGGDFYDFIPIGSNRTAIVIGDITGKGLDAARYTTIGKGAIRAFALEDPDPASVLGRASRVIHEQLGAENFITAVYMLIDLEQGSLSYAVAGHPPPLLRRKAGKIELLGEGGLPLGIEASEEYADGTACMEPGDRLLLYTDGLSEARRGKELFGIERTAGAFEAFDGLPVRDIASGIAEAAIAFAGGQLQDDLAIIVMERCDLSRA
ncbi:MAG TPA: SpoIIE family protein phosphatase [Coriobacteriia bacterium]|jgi:serine phosphatase RsbU (regulator of sigma subunit)/HAMP domain-containing protein